MRNQKLLTSLLVSSVLLTSFSFISKAEIAEAGPRQDQNKPIQKKSESLNQRKPKQKGQEPPNQAPAWGRHCNRGEINNHPGNRKCNPENEQPVVFPDGTTVYPDVRIVLPDGTEAFPAEFLLMEHEYLYVHLVQVLLMLLQ